MFTKMLSILLIILVTNLSTSQGKSSTLKSFQPIYCNQQVESRPYVYAICADLQGTFFDENNIQRITFIVKDGTQCYYYRGEVNGENNYINILNNGKAEQLSKGNLMYNALMKGPSPKYVASFFKSSRTKKNRVIQIIYKKNNKVKYTLLSGNSKRKALDANADEFSSISMKFANEGNSITFIEKPDDGSLFCQIKVASMYYSILQAENGDVYIQKSKSFGRNKKAHLFEWSFENYKRGYAINKTIVTLFRDGKAINVTTPDVIQFDLTKVNTWSTMHRHSFEEFFIHEGMTRTTTKQKTTNPITQFVPEIPKMRQTQRLVTKIPTSAPAEKIATAKPTTRFVPKIVTTKPTTKFVPKIVTTKPTMKFVPKIVTTKPTTKFVPKIVTTKLTTKFVPRIVTTKLTEKFVPKIVKTNAPTTELAISDEDFILGWLTLFVLILFVITAYRLFFYRRMIRWPGSESSSSSKKRKKAISPPKVVTRKAIHRIKVIPRRKIRSLSPLPQKPDKRKLQKTKRL